MSKLARVMSLAGIMALAAFPAMSALPTYNFILTGTVTGVETTGTPGPVGSKIILPSVGDQARFYLSIFPSLDNPSVPDQYASRFTNLGGNWGNEYTLPPNTLYFGYYDERTLIFTQGLNKDNDYYRNRIDLTVSSPYFLGLLEDIPTNLPLATGVSNFFLGEDLYNDAAGFQQYRYSFDIDVSDVHARLVTPLPPGIVMLAAPVLGLGLVAYRRLRRV